MARGRDWSALAPSTQQRYERAGISSSDYMSGASLKAARGHGTTPERPGAGSERPEYQGYYQIRREITELKKDIFGRVGKGSIAEMRGKSSRTLEKARDLLREMRDNQYSWEDMKLMYPELEADDWDWLGHYH